MNILNIAKWITGSSTVKDVTMTGKIVTTGGKFALVNQRTGGIVATYSRARDAKRGATRRGFIVT